MKRPAWQHYPGDWTRNAKLRRCSWAARGVWIEVLGLMHDSDEYGVLRWPRNDIALAVGCPAALVKELADKLVMKGSDVQLAEPYVHAPFHAGKHGSPVVLVAAQPGPIWFSSRFVRDEYARTRRGIGTRFGESPMPPTDPPTGSPTHREGDGPAVAFASASALRSSEPIESVRPSLRKTAPPAADEKANGLNGHHRATRLPQGWALPDEWRQWAIDAHDLDPQRAVRISLSFRDHWLAKPGKDGTKLDWFATWRNWVRRQLGDA